jgi:hypothetical protein
MPKTMIISIKNKEIKEIFQNPGIQAKVERDNVYITGIPDDNIAVYLARDAKTKSMLYLVHHPKEIKDYSCFRLHIGKQEELIEARVLNVERLRDGGTTDIEYILNGKRGRLHFPAPNNKKEKSIDIYDFEAIELENLIE